MRNVNLMVAAIILLPIGGAIMAQQEDSARIELAAKVNEIFQSQGADSAITFIEDSEDFKEVVTRYYNLTFDLFWREKNLDATVPVAQAGIAYCQAKATEFAEDTVLAGKLKGLVKVISFNLASFTWPGWAEEGITVTDEHMAAGLEAALLNVQVCEELGEDAKSHSAAHWSVGSHHLAAKDYQKAKEMFDAAADYSQKAEDNEGKLMNEGYSAMADILAGEEQTRETFDEKVAQLEEIGTDDSKFYAQQLNDVLEVFAPTD